MGIYNWKQKKTVNIDNLDQICPSWAFPVKNEKSEQQHWILYIRISLGIKFHLKMTILIFWTKLSQTGYFHPKIKKVDSIIEFCMIELIQVSSFTLRLQF